MKDKSTFFAGFFVGAISNVSIVIGAMNIFPKELLSSFPIFNPEIWSGWIFIHQPFLWILGATASSIFYGFQARRLYQIGKMFGG